MPLAYAGPSTYALLARSKVLVSANVLIEHGMMTGPVSGLPPPGPRGRSQCSRCEWIARPSHRCIGLFGFQRAVAPHAVPR